MDSEFVSDASVKGTRKIKGRAENCSLAFGGGVPKGGEVAISPHKVETAGRGAGHDQNYCLSKKNEELSHSLVGNLGFPI